MPVDPLDAETKANRILLYLLGATVGAAALIALVTSPVAVLLGDSKHAIPGALHGVTAILYVIVATISAYMAYRLYFGRLEDLRDLRIVASLNACLSLLTIIFGNWIYIYYRAKGDSPREYFLEDAAREPIHEIFFEFKEFLALFTLPLSIAAAYILLRERDDVKRRKWLHQIVAVLLVAAWAALMLTFGLGAAITKLRSV